MSTCKDCLHYEVCQYHITEETDMTVNECSHSFKNKADYAPVVRCRDCVYFQPDFVLTNDGERRPYTEEEKQSKLGMVSCEVGINCGSRCERHGYWEENKIPVWFSENDF